MNWNGQALRAAREAAGWNLVDLQAKSGVAISTISDLENENHEPRMVTVKRLSEALGVDWNFFFSDNRKEAQGA